MACARRKERPPKGEAAALNRRSAAALFTRDTRHSAALRAGLSTIAAPRLDPSSTRRTAHLERHSRGEWTARIGSDPAHPSVGRNSKRSFWRRLLPAAFNAASAIASAARGQHTKRRRRGCIQPGMKRSGMPGMRQQNPLVPEGRLTFHPRQRGYGITCFVNGIHDMGEPGPIA